MLHSRHNSNVDSLKNSNAQTNQPRFSIARLTNGFKFVETPASITEFHSREDDEDFYSDTSQPRNLESFNVRNSLMEEYNSMKLKEMQLASKITTLKSEIVYLRKMLVKNENDVRLKTAKVDRARDEAIELMVDLLDKKLIKFDVVPNWSYTTSESSLVQKNPSRRSYSADAEKKDPSLDVEFLNVLLKKGLRKILKIDSAALKTLSRCNLDRKDTT